MEARRGPDAHAVAEACARRIDDLVAWLGLSPLAKINNTFTPLNPTRGDRHPGSFVIYGRGHAKAGGWVDYACPPAPGSKAPSLAGDALDLIAYIRTGQARDRKAGYAGGLEFLGWGGAQALDLPAQEKQRRALQRDQEIAEKNAAEALAGDRREAFKKWLQDGELKPGSTAWKYLSGRRGIGLARMLEEKRLPGAIRTRARDYHKESQRALPSMAALFSGPDGKAYGVHRTFLKSDGSDKAEVTPARKMWPRGLAGGAIRLAKGKSKLSPEEANKLGLCEDVLAIGEGVETMLSVAYALPDWRVWAAGSIGLIGDVIVPACVRAIVLIGENDMDVQAQAAFARVKVKAAHQAAALGASLFVAKPPANVSDFNDALQALKAEVS